MIDGDTAGIFNNWESQLPCDLGTTGKPVNKKYKLSK
jgi:hypothetical protein